MASGKSEEDLLKEIAEKMAKNQISFDSKSDEEKEELVGKIDIVASSQVGELKKKFDALMRNIKGEIPENAKIAVLEGIMNKVEAEKLKSIDTAFLSDEVKGYASTVVTEIVNNNKEQADVKEKNEELTSAIILSNELLLKEEHPYLTPAEIQDKIEGIEEIIGNLDGNEMENLIERANNGDVEAQSEVIAIMSITTFVETNVTFNDMSENDKIRALSQLDNMAVLLEKGGSKRILAIAEQLSEKWGTDLISEDENGKRFIDRKKIALYSRKKGIDYSLANPETIYDAAKYYENVNGYDDMETEIKIDAVRCHITSNINIVYEKIKTGGKLEDYMDDLRACFAINFDASMRGINECAGEWIRDDKATSEECLKFQKFLLKEGLILYEDAKLEKNSGIIDAYVEKEFDGILDKSVETMKKNKKPDKDLIDLMLRVDPGKTKRILDEIDFSSISSKEQEESTPTIEIDNSKNASDKTKIDNLVNTLEGREKAKGIVDVLNFASNHIEKYTDLQPKKTFMIATVRVLENRENSYQEEERMARKKLFSTIISEGIYDEEILKSMVEIDSTTIKEMIDDLIEKQNSKNGDKLGTIMELSSSLKRVSDSNVISADKVNIEDVVRNIQENDNVDKDFGDAR